MRIPTTEEIAIFVIGFLVCFNIWYAYHLAYKRTHPTPDALSLDEAKAQAAYIEKLERAVSAGKKVKKAILDGSFDCVDGYCDGPEFGHHKPECSLGKLEAALADLETAEEIEIRNRKGI